MSPALIERTDRPADLDSVDPRLLARREQVIERRRRRRRRQLGGVLLVATLVALAAWALQSPLLDVADVRVSGNTRTSTEALLAASGVRVGSPLVEVHVDDVERAVEASPWVADARVRRDWSDGVVSIELTERTPVAALDAGEAGWLLVDADGRVLAAEQSAPAALPVLSGVSGAEVGQRLDLAAAGGGLQVAQLLTPGLRTRVVTIDVSDPDGIELRLAPSGVAMLGGAEDLDEKVSSLRVVLSQVDLTDLATIDLRIPDTPVLTREST